MGWARLNILHTPTHHFLFFIQSKLGMFRPAIKKQENYIGNLFSLEIEIEASVLTFPCRSSCYTYMCLTN